MLGTELAWRSCGRGLWRFLRRAAGGSPRALGAASSSAPPAGTSNVKPLDGVKILDLTRVLAGPFATMNLGDLGAEVIKVERPGTGDDTRTWGPPFIGTESVYFLSVNRNKKSIAINMKNSRGAKLIRELAAVSDVFVENYVPGKLAEIGLGYEDIEKIAPHIVYCSITGYGQTGPMVQRSGYDSIAAAISGLTHITGHEGGEPVRVGVAMTDLATGLYTCGAIMAGLLQRHKTGKGMHIDCNLLSSQVACLTHVAANYLNCKIDAKRWGTAHGSIVPYQSTYFSKTKYKNPSCKFMLKSTKALCLLWHWIKHRELLKTHGEQQKDIREELKTEFYDCKQGYCKCIGRLRGKGVMLHSSNIIIIVFSF
ncbi:succinate--hydroxymethylglutarate CoA-transferase isoform X7 [Centrocercus urophasianus]|uniref:succinate--hydroxymethylglutarate CoA-transferase isoform X7 n=1 Tax=Centrocercus urophasianus TaxID=9002 RepID=UPI001C652304|nr:succinate--hydroxymethylglutarate CoA-transferase isoform X7 [Centrocercus urophasianus]